MAHDTRSSRKTKDDENSNSKGKGLTNSSTETPATSSLRRSARETSSSKKNVSPSPSNTRKSERLEKKISTPPSAGRKSDKIEKRTSPIPLRRSERGKKSSSSSSSGSKKSDKSSSSSEMKGKKEKKEKSVKQLTMETKGISNESEKKDKEPVQVGKKRMDARTYRALFNRQPKKVKIKDHNKESNGMDNSSRGCSRNHKGESFKKANVDIDSSKGKPEDLREKEIASSFEMIEGANASVNAAAPETSEVREANSTDVGDSIKFSKSGDINIEASADAEQAQVDCVSKENLQSPELLDSLSGEQTVNGVIGSTSQRPHEVMPLKRKRNEVDVHSDALAVIANNDTRISKAREVITSSSMGCVDTYGTCFKRQRVGHGLPGQDLCSCLLKSKEKSDEELCGASILKDRGEPGVIVTTELAPKCGNNIQQNGSFVDIPTDTYQNTCFICKLGGKLLCCDGKGCKRSYHLSCLDPPLEDVPLGAWYCVPCLRKKIESGVHSLSKGIESIWDAREEEVSEGDGLRKQKKYFVKYKGLSHVHNRWVPESQLLGEAPSLVARFNRRNQVARWKEEWTLPHRLLQRRSLIPPKQYDEYFREHAGGGLDCHHEWLVKWCGLDYEHATWELENATFIISPEGQSLIRDYENRRKKAKRASCLSSMEKKTEKGFPVKLSQLLAGGSSASNNNLEFVNKLREYWHKGQNAVVFDDQDRISKVILFILSLLSDVCRPFLIISTSTLLHLWEDEFLRLAPSANVVVYNGNKEIRKCVRTLEFYEEGGCIMFQALITSPEVVIEDLNVFESIGWEAIIVDECQRSKVSCHFEKLKMLITDMKLLLVNGQLKDTIAEYVNILSFLDSQPLSGSHSSEGLIIDSYDTISCLKDKLSKYVVYGGKFESSRFVEFWVPVQISNVQLEQYCATLLSNSLSLCSPLKTDPVGALRDILISTRKCCDHPYLLDQSLQSLLIKDLQETEYLDVGIKASGKLQLLDTMLTEMKNQALRVLILFQSSGGSGKNSISLGDILDDFVRQRFGPDAYERVDGNVIPSKKQAALNNFNKESGRFVFLLETRACLPSIKLSSVDTVIIFDSDFSPVNDLRSLQKITIESRYEQLKLFRLYSSCTVEEKALILAKQDRTPDVHLQNMSRGISHVLLTWGASYLFNKLDEFHGKNASSSIDNFEQSLLKDVAHEFLTILTKTGEDDDSSKLNVILKVKQNRGTYNTSSPLFGESKIQVTDEGAPHIFWMKLLEGKSPCWKYCSGSSHRSRKRVQYFDDLQKKSEAEKDDIAKKQRKMANNTVDLSSVNPGLEGKKSSRNTEGSQGEFFYSQKSLHLLLKPQIEKLCEVLQLKEDVRDMVEKFLEYVMIKHHVDREPETILQAFQISLCWTAASLLKQRIDHKESLALAKQHLNFGCKREEADIVYSKFKCLKKVFLYQMEKFKVADCPKASDMSTDDISKDNFPINPSQIETPNLQKVKVEVDDWSTPQECSDNQDLFKVAQKDISKSISRIQKKIQKQIAKILQKHQKEKEDIDQDYEQNKTRLENEKRAEAAVIIRVHSCISTKTDRIKILEDEYAKRFENLKCDRDIQLKNLEAKKVVAMNKLQEKEANWVEGVKSWLKDELSNKPTSNESGHDVQYIQISEQVNLQDSHKNIVPVCSHSEEQSPSNVVRITLLGGVEPSGLRETLPDEALACSHPIETVAVPVRPGRGIDELDSTVSESTSVSGFKGQPESGNLGDNQEKMVSADTCSKQKIPDVALLSHPDRQIQLEVAETVNSNDDPENGIPEMDSSAEQIPDGAQLIPEDVVLMGMTKTACASNNLENVVSVNAPLCDEQIPHGDRTNMSNGEVSLRVPETATSDDCSENPITADFPLSGEQIPNKTPLNIPEAQAAVRVAENVSSADGIGNVASVNLFTSREEISDGSTLCMPDAEVQVRVPRSSSAEVVEGSNTNRENDESSAMSLDNATRIEQSDGMSYNVDVVLHLNNPSPVNSPSVQTRTTIAQNDSFPTNLALCSEATTSTGIQIEDAAAGEMHIPSQQFEPSLTPPLDDVASDPLNHGAPATQPLEQTQLLPSIDVLSGQIPLNFPSDSGVQCQPISENCITNQIAPASTLMAENQVELPNQAVTPRAGFASTPIVTPIDGLRTNVSDRSTASILPGLSNRPVQNAASVTSRLPLHLYHDPLQKELERICRERDKTTKIHEETKLQLKSDCDKEIEEAVAQIRRKFEIKLKETEAEFVIKKLELDANHNEVLMNKILAEAFKSKCMDSKASSAGIQELTSSFIQQLAQLSPQQTAQRPSVLAGYSSASLATTPTSTSTPPVSIQTASSVASQHAVVPPSQAAHSSALLSSALIRPPQIGSIISPAGNHQVGSGIRAPAPHLQPYRPSTSISSTSLASSSVLPTQQIQANPCATSLSPHPIQPLPPVYHPAGFNRAHRPETVIGLQSLPNTSLSALELLLDFDSRSGASPIAPSTLPSPSDLGSSMGTSVQPESAVQSNTRNSTGQISEPPTVVCLSDDDD